MICSVEDCTAPVIARGLCKRCYDRERARKKRALKPKRVGKRKSPPLLEIYSYCGIHNRLRRLYGPARGHACVECGRQAYHWSYNGGCVDEQMYPSRSRDFPFCLHVEHYRPRCVPCHWRHDDQQLVKPRPPHAIGENHPRALLTDDDVRAIRAEYATGGVRQQDLADRYGVTQPIISRVILRKSWKHLP